MNILYILRGLYSMLPVISEDVATTAFNEIFEDMPAWRKKMIHYIKEENPEINTAIIEAANKTNLDPKAVALGAYMTYLLIELASKESDAMLNYTE
jgi:effector-binding domain-containing protein